MEYYSATNTKIINVHLTTWMNFKNIVLNEKKLYTKESILYDSIYMTFWQNNVQWERKKKTKKQWLPPGSKVSEKGHKETF